jgi:hypothetical protein
MSGAIPLHPIHAFTAWTGRTLPFLTRWLPHLFRYVTQYSPHQSPVHRHKIKRKTVNSMRVMFLNNQIQQQTILSRRLFTVDKKMCYNPWLTVTWIWTQPNSFTRTCYVSMFNTEFNLPVTRSTLTKADLESRKATITPLFWSTTAERHWSHFSQKNISLMSSRVEEIYNSTWYSCQLLMLLKLNLSLNIPRRHARKCRHSSTHTLSRTMTKRR